MTSSYFMNLHRMYRHV